MPTPDRDAKRVVAGHRAVSKSVSMSELLASCAAANVVSTPPRPPAPPAVRGERRRAA